MFATHYHQLNKLQEKMKGIRNYNIAVREKDDKIIFLRKIVEGGTDKSYGIQVASLAGVPQEVIDRSKTNSSFARLKPLMSSLTQRWPKLRIHSPGWPYFQWLPMS